MDTYYKFAFVFWLWFFIAAGAKLSKNEERGNSIYSMSLIVYGLLTLLVAYYSIYNACEEYASMAWWKRISNIIGIAFLNAILPTVIMFYSIVALVENVPAWVSPFSNTIGYLFYKSSINELITDLYKSPNEMGGDTSRRSLLEKMYSDTSLFFNALTPENFDNTYDNLIADTELLKGTKEDAEDVKFEMKYYVKQKHSVGQLAWLFMAGLTAISTISTNFKSFECD